MSGVSDHHMAELYVRAYRGESAIMRSDAPEEDRAQARRRRDGIPGKLTELGAASLIEPLRSETAAADGLLGVLRDAHSYRLLGHAAARLAEATTATDQALARLEPMCECVTSCAEHPPTACSLSGQRHVHPELGPCPAHPEGPFTP